MSIIYYGVDTINNGYVDTSGTLLGAKQHATRNGYRVVYSRLEMIVQCHAVKRRGKWLDVSNLDLFIDYNGHSEFFIVPNIGQVYI